MSTNWNSITVLFLYNNTELKKENKMKKIVVLVAMFVIALTLVGCTEEPTEVAVSLPTEVVVEVPVYVEVEVEVPVYLNEAFYVEAEFEGSGYTPAYTYYLSGTLNDDSEITDIRMDMVSANGVSKRSNDYLMNSLNIQIGGTESNQTIELFVGGSSENIAQIFNTVKGENITSEMKVLDLTVMGAYPGAVVDHEDEIWGVIADGLGITIDATTTLDTFATAAGLYNAESSLFMNGYKHITLTGKWGGMSYDSQLTALEAHIVDNNLTLAEAYELVTTANQGMDDRDTVAGATVFFDPKIQETFRLAAGVEKAETEVEEEVVGEDSIYTVTAKGLTNITAEVTIDADGLVTSIVVTEHSETPEIGGVVIEDAAFIQSLIDNQTDLSMVDAVSGATLTTDALKEIVQEALNTHNS